MKKAFYNISEEKQNKIIKISIEEFSKNGYKNTSLNTIIKKVDISKGGMYKYIDSKFELFEYIINISTEKILKNMPSFKGNNIYDDLITYAIWEYDFYKENPKIYSLFEKIILYPSCKEEKIIHENIIKTSNTYFFDIIKKYNISTEKSNIIFWTLKGLNELYIKNIIEKESYISQLMKYINILKKI
ncbi:TetR family transcriptional regulator [Oceanotoga teriensis]|uniref:TetR family transcriptional regulator n=1 Tax=Oceanotoga teriensis TaxID=515440 RepID=A0AA45HIP2_9BACT|nr:TetR/AcrR family transcriptional regulator [Oceanotoga teriensis]PWJ95121.1 TetR family transcriptional regulator [Oceanotoga teriensis]